MNAVDEQERREQEEWTLPFLDMATRLAAHLEEDDWPLEVLNQAVEAQGADFIVWLAGLDPERRDRILAEARPQLVKLAQLRRSNFERAQRLLAAQRERRATSANK